MKISKIQKGLVLVTITAAVFAVGCELIVDFDRTKIPVELSEASLPDANVAETSTPGDGAAPSTDAGDSGTPSQQDSGSDASDSGSSDAADQ